jgi:coproporphyrinogen III oxidase-like Fe-S oxidoreductase
VKEISVETNPNHLNDEIMGLLKAHGVNRLSVGVQTFEDSLLKEIERFHKYGSGAQIRERLGRYHGIFDTLNVDMIFNFPTQTREMLERDLEAIKEVQADQVTFYPLMVSDLTRGTLHDLFGATSQQKEKLFYECILDALEDSYTPGTAWCFSRKESMIDEYIVNYDEYVGVGSGAFGYVDGAVFSDTFSIGRYIDEVNAGRFPLQGMKRFSPREQISYDFVMRLFGTSLNVEEAEEKFRGEFRRNLKKEIAFFRLIGALAEENGVLRLTRKGQYVWVIMMREFFIAVNNFRAACLAAVGNSIR